MKTTQSVKADVNRCYAVRCPSCKLFMNVAGASLNNERRIKCMNCGAESRTENWIRGSQIWPKAEQKS